MFPIISDAPLIQFTAITIGDWGHGEPLVTKEQIAKLYKIDWEK